MNELDTRLYALLERPARAEELKRHLPSYSKQQIRQSLDRLSAEGKILKNKKNRYAHAEHYGCLTGVFQATERGYGFVTPDAPDEAGDLFIPPYATGHAWQGDRVLVRLTESDRGHKREGEVLRILTLCQDEVSGTLMQRGKTVYVRPASKKYPNKPYDGRASGRSGGRQGHVPRRWAPVRPRGGHAGIRPERDDGGLDRGYPARKRRDHPLPGRSAAPG